MYRPGKPGPGPPPFRPPAAHGPPFTFGGACGVPPRGHLAPGPHGSFPAPAPDRQFLHNRPPREHFIRPHCSNFSIDRSTAIASGGSQKMAPHAEPPHLQGLPWIPTPAKHHLPSDSDRAGEEFLRCIAANKPLPDYLKGDMAFNLADAFKSANVLKDAVKSDPGFQKHGPRRISQSRSRSRSRGKSRGKSRCRSRGNSRGNSRGKSRAKSRARSRSRVRSRSRGRSKSHARGKSRARNKSRARSKSRSRSQSKQKSHVRSKSRVRRSKSRSGSMEKSCDKRKRSLSPSYSSSVANSNNLTGKCLLEGLKLVMNSKELEERMPTLKDAILTIQASDENRKVQCVLNEQQYSQDNSTSMENDSMLLPHDRVGSDFSWLQAQSQEDSTDQKADELDDEESFLYGNEDTGGKQDHITSTTPFSAFSQTGEQPSDVSALSSQQSIFSSFGDLLDLKQPLQTTSSINLDSSEFEKIKNILKSQGTANINQIMVKMQGQKEEKQLSPVVLGSHPTAASLTMQAMKNSNVQQALQSLQSLIKATKEKRAKSDGSGTSQTSDKHKASNGEETKRERQARKGQMESLIKEMEELLKQDGQSFLTPVIGFYCQKCEEFIGDLSSAENHAAIHQHADSSSKMQMDQHAGQTDRGSKGHSSCFSSSSNRHPHTSDKRDHRDFSYHRDSGDQRNHRDHKQEWRNETAHRGKLDDNHMNHGQRQEKPSFKEEMSKERMLITVSCGPKSPPNIRVKEEVNKEPTTRGYGKVKAEDTNKKDSKEKKDSKGKNESSDDSDDDKGKTCKVKSSKKKKKKEKKKKREKGNKS